MLNQDQFYTPGQASYLPLDSIVGGQNCDHCSSHLGYFKMNVRQFIFGIMLGICLMGVAFNTVAAKPKNKHTTHKAHPLKEKSTNIKTDAKKESTDPALKDINQSWLSAINEQTDSNKDAKPNQKETALEKSDAKREVSESQIDVHGQPKTTKLPNLGQQKTQSNNGLFPVAEGPSFFSVLLRFVGMMALFVGGFYLFMRYVKNKGNGTLLGNHSDLVEVIASVPLIQGKFIQIVDIAGKLMILGVSESGVQMLTEIQDGLTADKIRLWQSRRQAEPAPATLMAAISRTLQATDFKFWRDKPMVSGPSFEDVLRKQSPAAATDFEMANATQNQNDLFQPQPAAQDGDPDLVAGMDEITAMLQKHDRKLKSMSARHKKL